MAAQATAMEPAAAAAGEGQRFKRIPRQAWSGNLELDPLVRLAGYLLVAPSAWFGCVSACGGGFLFDFLFLDCRGGVQSMWAQWKP